MTNIGKHIAETYSVQTLRDMAVVYSISYLKTTANRDAAYAYAKAHKGAKTLDDTQCGSELCRLGYGAPMDIAPDELKKIWKTASERFIDAASGDITAFVDGADPRSTFCTVELPAILKNNNIQTINKTDKFLFAKSFEAS